MSVATVPDVTQPVFRLGHRPALDGLRGVAVALVVLFHLDLGLFTGGYLGVSVFFTLSGFLITSLLLERHARTGSLDLGRFYVRRIRRLVPASTATLCAIVVVSGLGGFVSTARSRGDLVAAALNVFNWRELTAGRAYADLFTGDSPVAHFWSLAIEEQFYVVWPLLLLGLLRLGRLTPSRVTFISTALFIAAAAASLTGSSSAAYFASWSRAAEILAGAALAGTLASHGRVPTWCRHLALPALTVIVVLSALTPAADGWAYAGGLPWFSLVSVAVIAGLLTPGPMTSTLAVVPLVALGRVSYGVYLVHWPVFVLVDGDWTGLEGLFLVLVRLGITTMLSVGMYVWIERPIRSGDRPMRLAIAFGAVAVGTTLIVSGALLIGDTPSTSAVVNETIEAGHDGFVDFSAIDKPAEATIEPVAVAVEVTRPRVLVVGSDLTALRALRSGLEDRVDVVDGVQPGCPISPALSAPERCRPALVYAETLIADGDPFDAVVVSLGAADEIPEVVDGATAPEEIIEIARFADAAETAANDLVDALASRTSNILVSFWGDSATTESALGRLVVERADVDGVYDNVAEVRRAVESVLRDRPDPTGPRVLVLGDSTSLVTARALDAAGDAAVVWAGDNGCPIVRASLLEAEPGSESRTLDCPDFEVKLPGIVRSFSPDVVLVMAGPTELAGLAFGDDAAIHQPGSDPWIRFHDREFDDLLSALTATNGQRPLVILADAPPIGVGPFSTTDLTRPERLDAWNAQIQRWARDHDRVDVWPYASELLAYERNNGSIRPDAVHADPTLLVPLLEDVVVDWVAAA